MSISGNLKTMELAELLQWVSQGKKTGKLVVEGPEVTKNIYFDRGRVVASGSTNPSEQLGHFLISHGHISEVELNKAVSMQAETGMLLGMILVTIGGISENDLRKLLVYKTEESIYELFTWSEAEFRFVDGESLERGMIPLALDVTAIILHGMNRLDEWNRIRKVIPNNEVVPVAIAALDNLPASSGDKRILGFIDDDRTIEEICFASHGSEFQVSRLVLREIEAGNLKIVVPRPPSGAHSAATPTSPSTSSTAIPKVDAQALLELAFDYLAAGELTKALRHARAARSLEPEDKKVVRRLEEVETAVREGLAERGLNLRSVPVLERRLEELTNTRLSPEEGFLLTRIDGSNSIENLLRISPLNSLDAQLVFFKLLESGHIRLVDSPAPAR